VRVDPDRRRSYTGRTATPALSAKDHVNVSLNDGRTDPDPDGIIIRGRAACHAVRAVVARLGVAEAQHDVAPARLEYGVQAGDVGGAVGGIEDVEQAAVEHRVERLGGDRPVDGRREAGTAR
jgi:hypothetical protein